MASDPPPTLTPGSPAPPTELAAAADDSYELGVELARGGMGKILLARDRRLDRTVALKVCLDPDGDRDARFAREALLTARLEHPGIVAVHEAGRWPSGEPFYAMRRVVGRPLELVIAEAGPLDARLALVPHVLAIAEALAYAHGQRVIHRDLKPANVIVGAYGETVVLDWGLAKDLAAADAELAPPAPLPDEPPTQPDAPSSRAAAAALATGDTLNAVAPTVNDATGETLPAGIATGRRSDGMTAYGSVMGTPGFMPPEQAAGQLDRVDERADVYAIGAILYHVLAGRPPFEGRSSAEVLARSLLGPPEPLDQKVPGVPDDLATICAKAMQARPADRYRTAQELAADLRRYTTGQLVGSHKYSTGELVGRWIRRHRGPLAVAAGAAVLLAALAVWSVVRIVRERDRASAARVVADEARATAVVERELAEAQRLQASARADDLVLAQARLDAERDPAAAIAALAALSPGTARFDAARTIASAARVHGLGRPVGRHAAAVTALAVSPDGATVCSAGADRIVRLTTLATGAARDLTGHEDYVLAATFSADGKHLATGSYDKTVRVWDLVAGGPPRVLQGHGDNVFGVAFTPDGTHLLSLAADDVARVWDVAAGATVAVHAGVRDASIAPDGRAIALGGLDGTIRIVDVAGKPLRTIRAHTKAITWLTYDAVGRILSASEDGSALETDPTTWRSIRMAGHGARVSALAGVAGNRVVTIAGKTVRVWTMDARGTPRATVLGTHAAEITGLLASPDGRRVVTLALDRSVRLWQLEPDRAARTITLGEAEVTGAVFASDHALVTGDTERWVRLWDLDDGQPEVVHVAGPLTAFALAPDGQTIAAGGEDGAITLLAPGAAPRRIAAHGGAVEALAFAADGKTLASGSGDRTLRLWDVATLAPRAEVKHADTVAAIAFAGPYVVTACHDGEVRRFEAATAAPRAMLATHSGFVRRLAVSPDGARVASAGDDGVIRVTPAEGGDSLQLVGHTDAVLDLAWSPDGTSLASAGMDGTVRVWTFPGGVPAGRVLATHAESASVVAWSARGDLVASGGYDGVIRLSSPSGGASRELRGHRAALTSLALATDGRTLVSGSLQHELFVWDVESGERQALAGADDAVTAVAISGDPSGAIVIAASRDGRVARWPDDLPRGPALRAWLERASAPPLPGPR